MTRRQSRLGFGADALFSFGVWVGVWVGVWAPTAAAEGSARALRDAHPMKDIKVVVIKDAFALGTWSGSVRRAKGLSIDETGITEGREIALSLTGLKRQIYFEAVQPFVETGIEFSALETMGFAQSGGGSGTTERSTRWRVGAGLAIPIDVASYSMSLEPSFHYALTASALTASKFSNQAFGLDFESKRFTSHAIQLGLGSVIPIGTVGRMEMSVDLGARAHIPFASNDSAGTTLAANSNIEFQGGIAIRANFAGLFGDPL